MTDKELLELAAKAAGYDFYWMTGAYWLKTDDPFRDALWNPLTDDGDAFALAVKLHLFWVIASPFNEVQIDQKHEDLLTATRRAIVRAAAEIGKDMK